MLSNYPDWILLKSINEEQIYPPNFRAALEELDSRYPDSQYGDCDNCLEFLPTEPEWDDRPVEEMEYEEGRK